MTNRRDEPSDTTTPLLNREAVPTTEPAQHLLEYKVVLLTCVIIFLVEFGAGLQIPSTIALLEQRLCYDVNPTMNWPPAPDDPACKDPDVQSRLAFLRGFQASLDVIPGLLTGIPYGMLSDRWGRKPVMLLAIAGYILSVAYQVVLFSLGPVFPVWMMLFSTAFTFIGGSPSTISAMLFTSIAEVVAPANRANVFFAMSALFIVSEILSGPLAGVVLSRSALGLLVFSLVMFLLTFAVGCMLPETLDKGSLTSSQPFSDDDTDADHDSADPSPAKRTLADRVRSMRNGASKMASYTATHKALIALMASFVFIVLGRIVQEMLLQYTTKRYHWSWSKASFVLTIRSVSNLIVLVVVMPALSRALLAKFRGSSIAKDLWISRFSGVAGIVGFLLIAIASNPTILCIGLITVALSGGMNPALRSLLNNMVPQQQLGTLNSVIVLMELASMLVASPVLAQSLSLGMRLGGAWIGLPFFCAAGIVMVSATIVWVLRISDIWAKSDELDRGIEE